MAEKRVINRIGDVYCVEIDNKYKCYFQYLAKDETQLCGQVIRVFKNRYPMDYVPEIESIVKDEVSFYTHTLLVPGINCGAWYKIGNSKKLDLEELSKVVFTTYQPGISKTSNKAYPQKDWFVWNVNSAIQYYDKLPKNLRNTAEQGAVWPYIAVIERIKLGCYTWISNAYIILPRKLYPEAEAYLKFTNSSYTIYYHYCGQKICRQIVDKRDKLNKYSDGNIIDNRSFTDVASCLPQFISKDEFEELWDAKEKPGGLDFEQILGYWKDYFFELTSYAENGLFRRIGPILAGIKVIPINDLEYKLQLLIQPLWNLENIGGDRNFFDANLYVESDDHLHEYTIQYYHHFDTVDITKIIIRSYFDSFVLLNQIILSKAWHQLDLSYNRDRKYKTLEDDAHFFELKMGLALYYDQQELIDYVFEQIDIVLKYWRKDSSATVDGLTFDQWLDKMHHQVEHRKEFMQTIRRNSKLPIISEMNNVKVINVPFKPETIIKPITVIDKLKKLIGK